MKKYITQLRLLLKKTKQFNDIKNRLEFLFKKISNTNKDYNNKYNLAQIFKNQTIKELKRTFKENNNKITIIIELVEYNTAPKQFVIIYNEFKEETQTELEIYI